MSDEVHKVHPTVVLSPLAEDALSAADPVKAKEFLEEMKKAPPFLAPACQSDPDAS